MAIQTAKGTGDILPESIYKWKYVEKAFFELCRKYGLDEIRTPTFEYTELFKRGVGDTTDIVEKQMFTFEDSAGRSLTLRPEGTSPVARAFIGNAMHRQTQPTKFSYEVSCFRNENVQAGRFREFHQFGIEILGSKDMLADAEVICFAHDFFSILGIRDALSLRINSIGCPVCRKAYREKLQEYLRPKYDELCDTCKSRFERNPMRILDCKSEICQALIKDAPLMLDSLCGECAEAFADLQANLKAMDVPYQIDPKIVRGLDYYTKTAFEFVSENIGAQGTVCGGGRYDHLIAEIGGQDTPGIGFGLGVERLLLVMENCGLDIPKPGSCDICVVFHGEEAKTEAIKYLRKLRHDFGLRAELDVLGRNTKGQFKYADKLAAKYAIIIGEEELKEKMFTFRNMESGQQVRYKDEELERIIREI